MRARNLFVLARPLVRLGLDRFEPLRERRTLRQTRPRRLTQSKEGAMKVQSGYIEGIHFHRPRCLAQSKKETMKVQNG